MTGTIDPDGPGRRADRHIRLRGSPAVTGIAFAMATVLSWASFNVAAKHGIDSGLAPADLAFLRFGVAGLILLPALLLGAGSGKRRPTLSQACLLAVFGGPVFGTIAVSGYQYAPLSHGLLFAPAAVLIIGALLGWLAQGERLGPKFVIGAAIALCGLTVLSGFDVAGLGPQTLKGDGLFVFAGTMWAVYTYLMRRWRIDPVGGTVAVGSVSAVLALPMVLLFGDIGFPNIGTTELVVQVIMQGLIGGILSVVFLLAAIGFLGTARASLLPAMTPGVAMIISFLVFGSVPSIAELAGIVLVSAGLALAVQRAATPPS